MQIFSLQLSPSWRDIFSPVDIRTVQAGAARARIFKLIRGPRIDSKESITLAYVAWQAGTTTLFLLGS
jgi:hypothetical protein